MSSGSAASPISTWGTPFTMVRLRPSPSASASVRWRIGSKGTKRVCFQAFQLTPGSFSSM